jgi:hypothetical protein
MMRLFGKAQKNHDVSVNNKISVLAHSRMTAIGRFQPNQKPVRASTSEAQQTILHSLNF